jgi:hypothetical protein
MTSKLDVREVASSFPSSEELPNNIRITDNLSEWSDAAGDFDAISEIFLVAADED